MFRIALKHVQNKLLPRVFKNNSVSNVTRVPMFLQRANISKVPIDHDETVDEYIDRMECYLSRGDIDGWELRKGLNELAGLDVVPEPRIIMAALNACRRCNDYAMTVRLLEMVKYKCGPNKDIYPYLLEHIEPCLNELGVDTPEDLGYGVPECWLEDVHHMHG